MRFQELTAGVSGRRIHPELDPEIGRIAVDSRLTEPGDLFVALTGGHSDAHRWVGNALDAGAVALILEEGGGLPPHLLEPPPVVPILIVADSRSLLAELADRFNRYPTRDLVLVAITGTNGKTTTAVLLESMFRAAGQPCGVIGTLFFRLGGWEIHGRHTTPQAHDLFALLGAFRDRGARAVVMEASSHGLDLRRLDGALVDVGVFTNLSLDHLDWHGDMEAYFAAKRRLFAEFLPAARRAGKPGVAVINADDAWGRRLIDEAHGPIITYGLDGEADVRARSLDLSPLGSQFDLCLADGAHIEVELPLVGRHNVINALAAAAAAEACGLSVEAIAAGLAGTKTVRGRFERVVADGLEGPAVFVDYAHTPDALEHVLGSLRQAAEGPVWVVFGCGGDRDRSKRPEMGQVAAKLADVVVVTSDNPRGEDPDAIIADIVAGFGASSRRLDKLTADATGWTAITGRRDAIFEALAAAPAHALVLIAGKGHETTQQIGETQWPFDDREVALQALELRAGEAGGAP